MVWGLVKKWWLGRGATWQTPNIGVSCMIGKFLTDIVFYVTNIPRSTCTICEHNLIKWCQ